MKTNSQQNTLKSGLSSYTRRIIHVFFHRHLELGEQKKKDKRKKIKIKNNPESLLASLKKKKKKGICASLKFSHCLYFPNNQLTILLTRMCTKSKTGLYVRCWSLSTREALTGNTCDCCSIIFVTIEYLRN